jgi:GDP-4-dehydro-6-deoxy-D-mannose reductase
VKVLITGHQGFVGKHLAKLLEAQGHTVYGFDLKSGGDLRDYEAIHRAIDTIYPDRIFHLAAQTYPQESVADPQRSIDTNITGTLNLLNAVKNIGLRPRIHLASSTEAVVANNPYGISKVAMENLGAFFADVYGLSIVCTRAANHAGPGQPMSAVASFARQVVAVERGEQKVIEHGDLSAWKSYLDVRDVVKAYVKAIELPAGTYTIAGEPVQIKTVLALLIGGQDIPTKEIASLSRPYTQPKIEHRTSPELDWKPEIELEVTLKDVIEERRSM